MDCFLLIEIHKAARFLPSRRISSTTCSLCRNARNFEHGRERAEGSIRQKALLCSPLLVEVVDDGGGGGGEEDDGKGEGSASPTLHSGALPLHSPVSRQVLLRSAAGDGTREASWHEYETESPTA